MLFVKRLLQAPSVAYYTLNVVFTPSDAQDATCTLTYNGQSYTSTSATVEAGTVISYSISHSKYGNTSGTITMDGNKTLTCSGTTTETRFNQPTLTADGTLGGNYFAVYADSHYSTSSSYVTWHAVDGNANTDWLSKTITSSKPEVNFILYNPDALRIESIEIINRHNSNCGYTAGSVLASNTNSNYTTIKSGFTNSNTTKLSPWTIQVGDSNYYKYIRLHFTAYSGTGAPGACQINLNAYTASYSWTIAIS